MLDLPMPRIIHVIIDITNEPVLRLLIHFRLKYSIIIYPANHNWLLALPPFPYSKQLRGEGHAGYVWMKKQKTWTLRSCKSTFILR